MGREEEKVYDSSFLFRSRATHKSDNGVGAEEVSVAVLYPEFITRIDPSKPRAYICIQFHNYR